jgi:hypothetical protein
MEVAIRVAKGGCAKDLLIQLIGGQGDQVVETESTRNIAVRSELQHADAAESIDKLVKASRPCSLECGSLCLYWPEVEQLSIDLKRLTVATQHALEKKAVLRMWKF